MKRRALLPIALGVDTRCADDLLRYFQRHPTAYVTTEQLASCVGYVPADIESGISILTRAGLLVQRRRARRKAAIYRLELSRRGAVTNGTRPLVSVDFVDARRLCEDYERLSKVAKRQLLAAMAMRSEAKRMTVRADDMMARAVAARAIVARPRTK